MRTFVEACSSTGHQPPFLAKPEVIPPNSYLMLGDNRGSSYDGRCWGVVPRDHIIGQAVVRFWPLNKIGPIDQSPVYPSAKPLNDTISRMLAGRKTCPHRSQAKATGAMNTYFVFIVKA